MSDPKPRDEIFAEVVWCRHCADWVPFTGLLTPIFCPRCRRLLRVELANPVLKPSLLTPLSHMDRRLLKAAKIATD